MQKAAVPMTAKFSNAVNAADYFHADLTCKGTYHGVGSIESTWKDEEHVVGKVRFTSKTKDNTDGRQARQMVWIQESTAVFMSQDCGDVKPRKIPLKPASEKTQ